MAGAAFKEMSRHVDLSASMLGFTFEKLTNFFKIHVNFFLTNNNCVNARFLSRFIARKLKQNYPLKQLLNPIRKELVYVIALSKRGRQSYHLSLRKKSLTNRNNIFSKRELFKNLLCSLFVLYNKQILFFFNQVKT
jgi:hypothetical protein